MKRKLSDYENQKSAKYVKQCLDGLDDTSSKRLVILDGSNIAFFHSNHTKFSVRGLEIAINEILRLGHKVVAIVPEFRTKPFKTTDPALLQRLVSSNLVKLVCRNTTERCLDDFHILQHALEHNGVIVSNDNYLKESGNHDYRNIIESRVIPFMFFKDKFMLPEDPYGEHGPSLSSILNA